MKALVILANDFEDIEAVTVIDVLDRAGMDVTKAALGSKVVESAHGIRIMVDVLLNQIDAGDYDLLVLPGGPGHKNLLNSAAVIKTVKEFDKAGKTIAAICAAPVVLAEAGVIDEKTVVVHPGYESRIPRVRDARVLVSGNIITSQAPGTAMEFALMIVEKTIGKKISEGLRKKMMVR
jgi:4-methyl-5(b-hydroxyethyl)-thiazole monophosphate biosynthesis